MITKEEMIYLLKKGVCGVCAFIKHGKQQRIIRGRSHFSFHTMREKKKTLFEKKTL